jgi:DNA-binding MarR family transcriptional regulator
VVRSKKPRLSRASADASRSIAIGDALQRLSRISVRSRGRGDLSLSSLSTLSTLERIGQGRITDLALVERMTQPAMTVLVNALERDQLVERHHDPSDKRVSVISLTRAGAQVLRSGRRSGAKEYGHLIDRLSPDEFQALVNALPALIRLKELDDEERDVTP